MIKPEEIKEIMIKAGIPYAAITDESLDHFVKITRNLARAFNVPPFVTNIRTAERRAIKILKGTLEKAEITIIDKSKINIKLQKPYFRKLDVNG